MCDCFARIEVCEDLLCALLNTHVIYIDSRYDLKQHDIANFI